MKEIHDFFPNKRIRESRQSRPRDDTEAYRVQCCGGALEGRARWSDVAAPAAAAVNDVVAMTSARPRASLMLLSTGSCSWAESVAPGR